MTLRFFSWIARAVDVAVILYSAAIVRVLMLHVDGGDAGARDPRNVRVVMHVHTSTSRDGYGTAADVAQAARATGTDVVWLTDHEAREGEDRRVDGVLLLHGVEHSTSLGHMLILGGDRLLTRDERKGDALAAAKRVRGFTVAAHADRKPRGGWNGDASTDAFEIYNMGTDGLRALTFPFFRLAWALLAYPLDGRYALSTLIETPSELIDRWDRALSSRPTVGLCSTDAHGLFPPYESLFAVVANYVALAEALPDDPQIAHAVLLAAVRAGRVVCALEAFGSARGVRVHAKSEAPSMVVGDEVTLPATLAVESGYADGVRGEVIRNGAVTHTFGASTEFKVTEAGAYRVQLRREVATFWGSRWAPWVWANPIVFRPAPPRTTVPPAEALHP